MYKRCLFALVFGLCFVLLHSQSADDDESDNTENQVDTYKEDNEQDTYNDGEEDPLQRVDDEEGGPDEEDDEEYQEEEDDDYEPTIVVEDGGVLKDFPGTLWCIGRQVENDPTARGSFKNLDECCMTHSLCPKIVHKEKEKYGVENTAGYTMRDCKCENDFSTCLMTSGKIAKDSNNTQELSAILTVASYYEKLSIPCFRPPPFLDESKEEEVDTNPTELLEGKTKKPKKNVGKWPSPLKVLRTLKGKKQQK